jgi:hypothetical protein
MYHLGHVPFASPPGNVPCRASTEGRTHVTPCAIGRQLTYFPPRNEIPPALPRRKKKKSPTLSSELPVFTFYKEFPCARTHPQGAFSQSSIYLPIHSLVIASVSSQCDDPPACPAEDCAFFHIHLRGFTGIGRRLLSKQAREIDSSAKNDLKGRLGSSFFLIFFCFQVHKNKQGCSGLFICTRI